MRCTLLRVSHLQSDHFKDMCNQNALQAEFTLQGPFFWLEMANDFVIRGVTNY